VQPIVAGYANYGVGLFAALLVAGWWIARSDTYPGRMVAAVWAPLGMLVALALNQPVATAVDETRPCRELTNIVVLHCNTDPRFPSDHAVMAGAVTAGLWLVSRRLGLLTAAAAAVMAFARVYVGAHYPQDVLGGLVFGAAVSPVGYLLAWPLLRRLLALAARTPLKIVFAPSVTKPVELQDRPQ
jgi:undecaprenyl-diphosphatase